MDVFQATVSAIATDSSDTGTNVPIYWGYISCGIAVVFFGSNWVPVKKFETGDGKHAAALVNDQHLSGAFIVDNIVYRQVVAFCCCRCVFSMDIVRGNLVDWPGRSSVPIPTRDFLSIGYAWWYFMVYRYCTFEYQSSQYLLDTCEDYCDFYSLQSIV